VLLVTSPMNSYGLERIYGISMERAVVETAVFCYEIHFIVVHRPYTGGYA
jgi:hypothetical protein